MQIVIEIGTPEQQELIKRDLEPLAQIVDRLDPPLNINRIIIAEDLEAKVNELQETTSYKAIREHGDSSVAVMAKNVYLDEKTTLILSPSLYTKSQDTLTRYFIFIHELMHEVNKRDFPPTPMDDFTVANYSYFLHWLYDEYSADRYAYEIIDDIFPEKSEHWTNFIQSSMEGNIIILKDAKNYEFFKNEIEIFRNYQTNTNQYIAKIKQKVNDLAVATIHAVALIHHYPDKFNEKELLGSKFVNIKTQELIDYLQSKFSNDETELSDGLDIVTQYMTNFGFLFEELETGPYCHVLDI
jgi:hypothetical protein